MFLFLNCKKFILPISLLTISICGYAQDFFKEKKRLIIDGTKNHLKSDILQIINNNEAIIFNLSKKPAEVTKLAEEISGLQFPDAKYIIVAKDINGHTIAPIEYETNEKELEDIAQSIENKIQIKSRKRRSIAIPEKKTIQGRTTTVVLSKNKIKCPLPTMYYDNSGSRGETDLCKEKAALNLIYKIEQYGSKVTEKQDPISGRLTRSEEGKFVIITVSPQEGGGTGWHLSDKILHQQNIYSNYPPERDEYAGPLASNYEFWVIPYDHRNQFQLIETYPQNQNPKTSIREEKGFIFGFNGKMTSGSTTGFATELGITTQFNNLKHFMYDTNEYTIENNSHDNMALWNWNLKLDKPINLCQHFSYESIYSSRCETWVSAFNNNNIIRTDKLSSMTHKSFTPTFQAVYKAPKSMSGKTTFEVGTRVEASVLLGSMYFKPAIIPLEAEFLLKRNFIKSMPYFIRFNIDWDSPSFETEQNIYLKNQNTSFESTCLTVVKNQKVILSKCLDNSMMMENLAQTWGYDNVTKQFKSRLKKDQCLTANQNGNIFLAKCSNNSSQEWIFNNGQLILTSQNNAEWKIGVSNQNEIKLINLTETNSAFMSLALIAYPAFLNE